MLFGIILGVIITILSKKLEKLLDNGIDIFLEKLNLKKSLYKKRVHFFSKFLEKITDE